MNYKLPDIDPSVLSSSSFSNEDIKNIYRKFFAEMRLNRLQYHMLLLEFFVGKCTKEELISSIQTSIDFMDKISLWIENLKLNGNYEEFKKTCKEEIKAIDIIIQTYEDRMRNAK